MADTRQDNWTAELLVVVWAIVVMAGIIVADQGRTIRSLRQQLSQQPTVIERNCNGVR